MPLSRSAQLHFGSIFPSKLQPSSPPDSGLLSQGPAPRQDQPMGLTHHPLAELSQTRAPDRNSAETLLMAASGALLGVWFCAEAHFDPHFSMNTGK
ncbi:hypothetical protein Dda_7199 [Drechslerella dactyloides]|uniref:Uncharacterized protein n=1 Tax=Drechslerella dactyloides TaxID=74499 RepID=A0AAD6NHB1_DREDA|nr:hypothetical protein Dda_7199 [Drechslerella dactyloides]